MSIEHWPGMVGIRCDVCRRRDLYRTGAEMRSASARDIRRAAKRDGWWRRKQRYGLRSTVLETRDATYIDLCPECDRLYRLTCGPDTERGETPPRP
jgi:hypothetical protein